MRTVCRYSAFAALALLALGGVALAQTSPYYITDGDSAVMFIVQNGAIQSTVTTFRVGEAIAVRDTVMLCDYNEEGVREYTLAGVPTGRTYTGPGNYYQLLDGTTDGAYNYTIAWAYANPNPVLRYDRDWQNPTVLFYLPSGVNAMAITYDPTTTHLFIAYDFATTIHEFTLAGSEVNSFDTGLGAGRMAGLAYEPATNSLWFKINGGDTIYNYSKAGARINAIIVPNLGGYNDYGGEFALPAGSLPVPMFSAWGFVAMALLVAAAGWFVLLVRRDLA